MLYKKCTKISFYILNIISFYITYEINSNNSNSNNNSNNSFDANCKYDRKEIIC